MYNGMMIAMVVAHSLIAQLQILRVVQTTFEGSSILILLVPMREAAVAVKCLVAAAVAVKCLVAWSGMPLEFLNNEILAQELLMSELHKQFLRLARTGQFWVPE